MPKSQFSAAYRRFTQLLVDARTEADLTQTVLAEKLGWQQTDISKVERGEQRLDVVEFLQFANALEIDAAEFICQLQKRG